MKLLNNTKCKFKTSKGEFLVGKIMDFDQEEANRLLNHYKRLGMVSADSLEDKPEAAPKVDYNALKKEADDLGLEYAGNIKKADLVKLVDEAKATK